MKERFHSWWQYIRKHWIAAIIVVFIVLMALIFVGYWFDWTGFNGYNQVTIAHTTRGPSAGTVVRTEVYQPGKSLWDWLQLLGVLAIPAVVGLGAAWYTAQQGKVSDRKNTDNQLEAALQAYIDKISELLLKEHLGELTADGKLKPEYKHVRNVARVRTITVLTQLNARRIGYVFTFLREAGLISTPSTSGVVSLKDADLRAVKWGQARLSKADLSGADLSKANLSEANLIEADLSGVNLSFADLSRAYLSRADLSGAFLSGANLSGAFLSGANLSGAATIHLTLGPNLSEANLGEANLSGAFLGGANLRSAFLRDANLSGAFLSKADLTRAVVTEEQLKRAASLEGATMPDGSIHP